jgi:hypothetical protein
VKRAAFAAAFYLTLGLAVQLRADQGAPAPGRILLSLEAGVRMRLVNVESGKSVAVRGAGLALRELPPGTWRVRRLDVDSLRERMRELPADRFVFRVAPGAITYIGDWGMPSSLVGGSGAPVRGRPIAIAHTESAAACVCTPRNLEGARARWPNELLAADLVLACASRSAPETPESAPLWEADCAFAP